MHMYECTNLRMMHACTHSFFGIIVSPLMCESPRWLVERNPNSAVAKHTIRKLYGLRTEKEVCGVVCSVVAHVQHVALCGVVWCCVEFVLGCGVV